MIVYILMSLIFGALYETSILVYVQMYVPWLIADDASRNFCVVYDIALRKDCNKVLQILQIAFTAITHILLSIDNLEACGTKVQVFEFDTLLSSRLSSHLSTWDFVNLSISWHQSRMLFM